MRPEFIFLSNLASETAYVLQCANGSLAAMCLSQGSYSVEK